MKVQFCMYLLETLKLRNMTRDDIKNKYYSVYHNTIDDRTVHRWVMEVNCYLCNYNNYTYTINFDKSEQMFYRQDLKISFE